jgi:hypothetical protein
MISAKGLLAAALLTITAGSVQAGVLTLSDAYGGQNPGSAMNNGDVIGLLKQFDIDNISFNMLPGGAVQINVRMNYGQNGGDTTLSGINVGSFPTVYPGDILVTSGSNRWAIPLVTHNDSTAGIAGLVAGNLYSVTGFLTSGTVLNNTNAGTYRPAEVVWGESAGAIKQNTGNGSVVATLLGGSEINVAINFTTSDTNFLNAFSGSGSFVRFAAATCANDVVAGDPVPEPMSLSLIGAGLLGLGLLKRKRSENR